MTDRIVTGSRVRLHSGLDAGTIIAMTRAVNLATSVVVQWDAGGQSKHDLLDLVLLAPDTMRERIAEARRA